MNIFFSFYCACIISVYAIDAANAYKVSLLVKLLHSLRHQSTHKQRPSVALQTYNVKQGTSS